LRFGIFNRAEPISSASIETAVSCSNSTKEACVTAIGLFTNRGRSPLATVTTEDKGDGKFSEHDVLFESIQIINFEALI